MNENNQIKKLIEDLRRAEEVTFSKEGCLVLANLIEEQTDKIQRYENALFEIAKSGNTTCYRKLAKSVLDNK